MTAASEMPLSSGKDVAPADKDAGSNAANAASGGLAAIDLCKSFKGRQVVDNVSLQFERREAIGLLGPNGAGKTTTFYMITVWSSPIAGGC